MGRLFLSASGESVGFAGDVTGFDTGLDSRSFARSRLSGLLTEPGLIVRPGKPAEPWNAFGVTEYGDGPEAPTMVVWGPAFDGERLDLIVNAGSGRDDAISTDMAMSAISLWLEAILTLDEKTRDSIPHWPCAALVNFGRNDGGGAGVFFAPPELSLLCMKADERPLHFSGHEWYVHPDSSGTHPAAGRRTAFTAAAMLYGVVAGFPPFPATDEIVLHQDIRDGNFLPLRLAAPGIDSRLADLVQRSLEGNGKRNTVTETAVKRPLPQDLLAVISPPPGEGGSVSVSKAVSVSSLTVPLSQAEMQSLEKEKAQFLKMRTASVNTRRFVARNTGILLGGLGALVAVIFFVGTIVSARSSRPTTEGMTPIEVVESYYNAFGELNHQFMENIVLRGVGRNDINTVVNLFVINRVRMAHEMRPTPPIIPATEWKEAGGAATDLGVFGVTDLQIEQVQGSVELSGRRGGSRDAEEIRFRADYLFWVPAGMVGDSGEQQAGEYRPPVSFRHSDLVTLVPRRGNWRISDISRVVLP